MPDFNFKSNSFPIGEVIQAAQRKAQIELQAQTQQNQDLVQGLQTIGTVGQSLVDKRLKVAQALALGPQVGIAADQAKAIGDPDLVLKAAGINKGSIPIDLLREIYRGTQSKPGAANAATTPASGTSNGNGAILASDQTTTPVPKSTFVDQWGQDAGSKMDAYAAANPHENITSQDIYKKLFPGQPYPANVLNSYPNGVPQSSGTVQSPTSAVPISAPPSMPRMVNKATADMAFKMANANRPEMVYSYDNHGNMTPVQAVPKGSKIERDLNTTGMDAATFIGNSEDGKPLFARKDGTIFFGKVPGEGKTPGDGSVYPRSSTQASAATRSSAEFATTIIPHISEMRKLIDQAEEKGFVGPASGRIYNKFLAGKVGSTGDKEADRLLGNLRATDSLLKSGALKVHFGSRGGQQMYEHFSEMLNSGQQSAAVLNGALDGIESFMKGYANAGKPMATEQDPSLGGAYSDAAKEKRYQDWKAKQGI